MARVGQGTFSRQVDLTMMLKPLNFIRQFVIGFLMTVVAMSLLNLQGATLPEDCVKGYDGTYNCDYIQHVGFPVVFWAADENNDVLNWNEEAFWFDLRSALAISCVMGIVYIGITSWSSQTIHSRRRWR